MYHTSESLTTLLPRFVLGAVVLAVVYGEIRIRTGSVWPAIVMHWTGNVIANGLLAVGIVSLMPGSEWLGSFGAEGTLMIALFAVVGGALYASRRGWRLWRRTDRRIGSGGTRSSVSRERPRAKEE